MRGSGDVAPPPVLRVVVAAAAASAALTLPGLGDAPRALAVRGLAALAVGVLAWRRPRGADRLLAAALALWVLTFAASAATAIDPVAAVWGTPGGRLGLATALAAALLACAVPAAARTARTWCAGGCVAAAGIALVVPASLPADGSPGWVALCGAGLSAWCAREPGTAPGRVRVWSLAAVACTAVALVAGGAAGRVGLWLGAAVTCAVLRDGCAPGSAARRAVTAGYVAAVVVPPVLLVVTAPVSPATLVHGLENAPPDVFVRGTGWAVALDAGRARPVLGAGAGSFAFAWDYFFPPRIADVAPAAMDTTSAGNLYLEAFAERGVPGALTEALLLVAGFVLIVRRRRAGTLGAVGAAVLAGLLTARAAHGLLASPDVAGTVTAAVVLGLCMDRGFVSPRSRTPWLRLVPSCLAALLLVVPPLTSAVRALPAAAGRAAVTTTRLDPLSGAVAARAAAAAAELPSVAPAERDAAHGALLARVAAVERDVRAARALGRLALGTPDGPGRAARLDEAVEVLEAVIDWAPTRRDLAFTLRDLELARGNPDAAAAWEEFAD